MVWLLWYSQVVTMQPQYTQIPLCNGLGKWLSPWCIEMSELCGQKSLKTGFWKPPFTEDENFLMGVLISRDLFEITQWKFENASHWCKFMCGVPVRIHLKLHSYAANCPSYKFHTGIDPILSRISVFIGAQNTSNLGTYSCSAAAAWLWSKNKCP